MKGNVTGWLTSAVVLLALGILSGNQAIQCAPTPPEEPVCADPADCDGLPHQACSGAWGCEEGACAWTCAPGPEYVMHEWGVFKMNGAGAEISTTPVPYTGPVPAKPILYFYSDEGFTFDAEVTFASGGATEVWPEIAMAHTIAWNDVELSTGACQPTPFPPTDPNEFDLPPEVTQLGPLVVDDAACLEHGDTVAKLLFYTGTLPDYTAPLTATYQLDEAGETLTATLTNASNRDIGKTFLIFRDVDSECIDPSGCWIHAAALAGMVVEGVDAGQSVTVTTDLIVEYGSEGDGWGNFTPPESWNAYSPAFEEHLMELGLSIDETHAFMVAWDEIFFGILSQASVFFEPEYEDGFFLIYAIPEAEYDEQLALTLEPPPAERVRVGVIYEKVDAQSCLPAQEMVNGLCGCAKVDPKCNAWCPEPGPDCTPGTWNDLTCVCDTIKSF